MAPATAGTTQQQAPATAGTPEILKTHAVEETSAVEDAPTAGGTAETAKNLASAWIPGTSTTVQ